jgi:hypothetical protein
VVPCEPRRPGRGWLHLAADRGALLLRGAATRAWGQLRGTCAGPLLPRAAPPGGAD